MKIYGITFKKGGKVYYFNGHEMFANIGDNVIVETEKGQQFGSVAIDVSDDNKAKNITELKDIIRVATKDDEEKQEKNIEDATKAFIKAKNYAEELDLKMNFIDANYTFDRKQLLFNFMADGRIDFRELAKKLASTYKTRIELRQIGVRDKAKEVGGLGQCGRKLCCASFLGHIDTVTINMAKNQNIALNPTKINGSCGRLLCCLAYEDDLYTDCRNGLPNVGDCVNCDGCKCQVLSTDVLNRSYVVDCNGNKKEIDLDNNENSKK